MLVNKCPYFRFYDGKWESVFAQFADQLIEYGLKVFTFDNIGIGHILGNREE